MKTTQHGVRTTAVNLGYVGNFRSVNGLPKRQARTLVHFQSAQSEESNANAVRSRDQNAGTKTIGLGVRGISAIKRLVGMGKMADAEFWALDSDKKVLSTCESGSDMRVMELMPGDDLTLSSQDLSRIAGTTVDSNMTSKDAGAGVAFVLGSAFGSPGGATLMLQLVNHLRRQGYFVGVALTRPFGFEGRIKLEQADALIEHMEHVASFVVVIDQGVLTRASSELTIPEASAIADNTLEYTVRSVLWALRAPEILKVTNGSFIWHGRDLRNMKRTMFPPMLRFITCPGLGNLGRGQAAIPVTSLRQAGLPSTLSTLAEDAVKAASESPFLENKMSSATAALCILRMPRCIMGSAAEGLPGYTEQNREYALRSAVQVAAMTVRELAGPHCTDVVVCPQMREEEEDAAEGGDNLSVECALLVLEALEDAAGINTAKPTASFEQQAGPVNVLSRLRDDSPSSAASSSSSPSPSSSFTTSGHPATYNSPFGGRMSTSSSSSSSPMSSGAPSISMAAGSSTGAAGAGGTSNKGAQAGAGPAKTRPNYAAMSMIAGGSAVTAHNLNNNRKHDIASSPAKQVPFPQRKAAPNQTPASAPPPSPRIPQPVPVTASTSGSGSGPFGLFGGGRPHAGQTAPQPSRPGQSNQQIPRMSETLVTSLVAQSLDLPPRAAKWRHQQRAVSQVPVMSRSQFYELPNAGIMADSPATDAEALKSASADVKSRTAGMLDRERSW
mmetsp:Transcript_6724/g.14841  ORF Transcript_6724/g.14841 Transcript_6724/m.14841 type:complete len:727 (-) Transcript_6724:464-2644(-)